MKQAGYDVQCEIYTDVDGVYTTDPRIVPDARKMDAISYDEMLEMASMGAGVMHSRSIEFAKKYDVPLMVRNAQSDAVGTWIVPGSRLDERVPRRAAWRSRRTKRGSVLEGVPDRPGVSHRVFAALADANIAVDMIGQSVGDRRQGDHRLHRAEHRTATRPSGCCARIVAELGATLNETGKVSKVSVVGAGMRTLTGVAERMFQALAAEGVNMKMITTGDIKISVLIEEDGSAARSERRAAATEEKIKKAHVENKKAVRGRKALRAVHSAFGAGEAAQGGRRADRERRVKPPQAVAGGRAAASDREAAVARLDGMEDVLVSGVHLNTRAEPGHDLRPAGHAGELLAGVQRGRRRAASWWT